MVDEYASTASVYDAIYQAMKDYRREATRVSELIEAHGRTDGNALLDVACGTGLHDEFLMKSHQLEGLDASEAMLSLARQRLSGVALHHGDMSDFALGRQLTRSRACSVPSVTC